MLQILQSAKCWKAKRSKCTDNDADIQSERISKRKYIICWLVLYLHYFPCYRVVLAWAFMMSTSIR